MTRMLWPRRSSLVLSEKTLRVAAFLLVPLLLGTVALGFVPVQASPRDVTFEVNSTLDEPDATPGDGSCVSTPSGLCTLRAAVQEANALTGTDTITLPAGTYTLTIPGTGEDLCATGDLDITASLTIQGAGVHSTIVDANGIDRAFQIFGPAEVTISGLAVQAGDSGPGAGGGGISMASGSTLTLEDVTLSGNTAGDTGGGIYNNGGDLVLTRVRVIGNNAVTAAGIRSSGSLVAYDSTIAGNHAIQTAGGILNTGALTLEAVTVSGNIAETNGGGLYLHSADPQVGLVTIVNSTISGNQAQAWMGGGIWVYYQTELWMTNSTIANNLAGQGGGIFNYHEQGLLALASRPVPGHVAQLGNIHFLNTLVADNLLSNCGRSAQTQPINSLGHNLDSGTTCEFAAPGDLVDTDPQLGLLQDNGGPTWTHALLPGSPAIDAGDDNGCPPTDQRGVTRPQGSACDIGAYESVPTGEANLGIGKADSPDPVEVAAPLAYTLSISNTGPNEATSVEVVDILPTGVEFLSASGSGWSCSHTAGEVTCTRPALAIGPAPDILINLLAPSSAGTITNTASVTSTVADPSLGNNIASEATLVEGLPLGQADLSIAKTSSPNPVEPGAMLTYTLTVSNAGPDTATAITVTDLLPPEVTYGDGSGAGWSCGQGGGTVTCTRPSLAVGVAPDIIIGVTAPAQTGTITNTAFVTSTVADPSLGNNIASEETLVEGPPLQQADLSIAKTSSPNPVEPGVMLTYTLAVANAGPDTATAITVTDLLPPEVTYGDVSGAGWSCSHDGGRVTCTRPSLAVGLAPDIVIGVIAPAQTGTITNTASVTSTVSDPSLGNNIASEATLVEGLPLEQADLSTDKAGSPNPVEPGAMLTYTLTVANAGPDTATAITVTDLLPPEVTYGDVFGAGWSCNHGGGTVTCTRPSLAVGVAPDIVIRVMAPTQTGTITNTATVSSQVMDPNPGNNSATVTTRIGLVYYIYLPLVLK